MLIMTMVMMVTELNRCMRLSLKHTYASCLHLRLMKVCSIHSLTLLLATDGSPYADESRGINYGLIIIIIIIIIAFVCTFVSRLVYFYLLPNFNCIYARGKGEPLA